MKIKKIMNIIRDMFDVIRKSYLDKETKDILEEKYRMINTKYSDFIENYLDFREIADNFYDGIYISNGK